MSSDPDREKGDGAGAGSAPDDAPDAASKSDDAPASKPDDAEAKPEPIEDPVAFTINKPPDRWTPDPLAGVKLSSPDIQADASSSDSAEKPSSSSDADDKPSSGAAGEGDRSSAGAPGEGDRPSAGAAGEGDRPSAGAMDASGKRSSAAYRAAVISSGAAYRAGAISSGAAESATSSDADKPASAAGAADTAQAEKPSATGPGALDKARASGQADEPSASAPGALDKAGATSSGADKPSASASDKAGATSSGADKPSASASDKAGATSSGSVDKPSDTLAPSASGSLEISVSYPESAASSSGSLEISVSGPESAASSSGSLSATSRDTAASSSGSLEKVAKRDASASSSGSLEKVAKRDASASSSGSLDVSMSSPGIPEAVPAIDSEPIQSEPISSARAVAAVAREGSEPVRRRDRIKKALQDGVSEGVETLGTGIETLGEGVTKIGDVTKKVPLVGANIGKLGEGLTKAGESIHALPRVAQTRRGRLLVRSVIVGFLLVFAWIAVIVGLQLRSHDTPDFRPVAEKILVEISKGRTAIGDVYEKSSPRFQEWSSKERFIDELTDLNATNGKFKEITAINETVVTKGRTGRIGRVNFTASYEHGSTRGTMSFHLYRGEWKLLGLSVEVPAALKITQAEREKRVAACLDDKGRDNSDQRAKCDVRDAAETVLEMIRDGKAGDVWDAASDIFKQQETRANFIRIQEDQRIALGNYKRLLRVTEARAIRGVTATFDMLAEFDKASGVRVVLGFTRPSRTARWQLRSFKVVVPMPRPDEEHPTLVPPSPDVNPNDPPLLREATPDLEKKLVPPPKGSSAR